MLRGHVPEYGARRDCGGTTSKGYIEILEFKHFVRLSKFNSIDANSKEKELKTQVTVIVALDVDYGNT